MLVELKQFIQERCFDFGTLYSLESEFNKIGLTIQPTHGGNMVLCRIINGEPVAESLGHDHLFIGVQSRPRDEIPHKLVKCVLEFIDIAGGAQNKLFRTNRQSCAGYTGLYGQATAVGPVVQDMALDTVEINDDLLGAVKEWCDDQA